jgi:hypothetical protein
VNITLDHEQIIERRFIDFQGQPIPGVTALVAAVHNNYSDDWSYIAVGDAPPWPCPVTSDHEGRLKLSGLSPLESIWLDATTDRKAREHIKIQAGQEGRTKAKLIALAPALGLDVRVARVDTNKPMPGAMETVRAVRRSTNRDSFGGLTNQATDDQGRAFINPYEGDTFLIAVKPPAGEPYVPSRRQVNWSKGAVRQMVDLRTHAEGRATFVSLIPGATYRIQGREFIAEAGKTVNLGDVVAEKPNRP